MNKKIKLSVGLILGVITLFGLFVSGTNVSAMTCDSATLTGYVITHGNSTRARFTYAPDFNTVASGGGAATGVQTFDSDGGISQFVNGLSESTEYFYRLEVTNEHGTDYTDIGSFQTPACQNSNPSQSSSSSFVNLNFIVTNSCGGSASNASVSIGQDFGNGTSRSTDGNGFANFGVFSNTNISWQVSKGGFSSDSGNVNSDGGNTVHATITPNAGCNQGSSSPAPSSSSSSYPYQSPASAASSLTVNNNNTNNNTNTNNNNINIGSTYSYQSPYSYQTPSGGQQPSVTISADDTNIDEDDSTVVRWSSNNANSCQASGGSNGWSGSKSNSGSFNTGPLSSTKTYTITCENNFGSDTDSVTVHVDEDNDNDNNGDKPDVELTADDTSIDEGDSTTLRWEVDDADSCTGSLGDSDWRGGLDEDGGRFETDDLDEDTTYKITCRNDEGSTSDSITIRVDEDSSGSGDEEVRTSSNVITSCTSATLNGHIETDGNRTTVWFEWGPSRSLGSRTTKETFSSDRDFDQFVSGLRENTTYYYRAVADNENGTDRGDILSFRTNSCNTYPTPYIYPTPSVTNTTTVINRGGGDNPFVTLTIDGGDEVISIGERRSYEVEWKNISSQTLRNVVLRVILPEVMNFEASNRGSFSEEDNTLTYEIDTLSPGEDGDLFIVANVGSRADLTELLVVTANLIFTDNRDVQRDAFAYATHRVMGGSVLGANVFGAGFLPSNLFGWLFLLILLFVLVAISRHLFGRTSTHIIREDNHIPL